MLEVAAAVAAVVVALWPQIQWAVKKAAESARVPAPAPAAGKTRLSVPSYADAIMHLAVVRTRLVATELLGDESKKAIDVLTLALVEGSDK